MWVLIWIILNPLYPRMLCVNFGWNWPSSSEERILNIFKIILLFCYYIPLEKGVALHLNKLTWIHSTQKWFVPSLLKLTQWFWRRFLILSVQLYIFVIIPYCKRAWPFIWINLNLLHPRLHCTKFGWNLPSGSGEEVEKC